MYPDPLLPPLPSTPRREPTPYDLPPPIFVSVPSAKEVWRQRLAGALLLLGSLAFMGTLFLPWVTGTLSFQCSDCGPRSVSPGQFMVGCAVPILLVLALPLTQAYIGLRLLCQPATEWDLPDWKRSRLLAIISSAILFPSIQALQVLTSFAFMMTGRHLRADVGYNMAMLTIIVLLIASLIIPTRLKRI